mgnify:CR=1 FL=1
MRSDSSSNHATPMRKGKVPVPPAPAGDGGDVRAYVRGLGDMYVADPRFAANYGGVDGATFVRDALRMWADRADT